MSRHSPPHLAAENVAGQPHDREPLGGFPEHPTVRVDTDQAENEANEKTPIAWLC